ncbi:MAG: sodium-translocating pyrophosphatase [Puniceicoccales bacterium]|jgi:K(+)-stimulated pyrophosphate-energized sodium pump|nr:sodium-translocating pyrophosphatase [Puniceicoccales bacterium]
MVPVFCFVLLAFFFLLSGLRRRGRPSCLVRLCSLLLAAFFAVLALCPSRRSSLAGLLAAPDGAPFFWLIPLAALFVLAVARYFYCEMLTRPEGNGRMRAIAGHVREGAMAYLLQQYRVVICVFLVIALLLAVLSHGFQLQNPWLPFSFLTGGLASGLAGFLGMRTATAASSRTAQAAMQSLGSGLRVAFRSGAVMGLVVVGLALLDYSFWFYLLNRCVQLPEEARLPIITGMMVTFGMGVSLQALFARVGGGIFTKAADVGADLVGKVEAGIPEDDPRNPATIADNVGDNVGDVAGMGADLYESFYGSILAAAALGAVAFRGCGALQMRAVLLPVLVGALGAVLSVVGIFAVHTQDEADAGSLLRSLARGVRWSSVLILAGTFLLCKFLGLPNAAGLWGAVATGLLTGVAVGKSSEYYTSQAHGPTRRVAAQSTTGSATVVIGGIGLGMLSTAIPVLAVVVGTICSYGFASCFDFSAVNLGLYGIGVAAVGMLSTLGITLASDAYGPIADNAGGNAEMSGLGADVRRRTDALDALGNTTAATGKGFAIGSAALTALALLASYIEAVRTCMMNGGQVFLGVGGHSIYLSEATVLDFMDYFEMHLLNPKLLLGLLIGSMLSFVFCGLTMNAVGRAAGKMVDEVRRQFREIPGILENRCLPNYGECVRISASAAQREMICPALVALVAPVAMGLAFGVPGVLGLLCGSLASGFVLAIFMANAGGCWDNAKKYIEEGNLGGKGSPAHRAAVVGDTVGDPFKDTAGPSLNILLKLMTIVAIVTVGITVSFSLF